MSDIDLWNKDLLDTHLDLLGTDITTKHFVCLQDVLKASSRYVFKTFSRHVFKTPSRHAFKMSWRRLQHNNFSSSKTSSRRLGRSLENVFNTSSRRLGRRKIVTLKTCWRRPQDMSWRRPEDVLKTNKCLLGCVVKKTDNVPFRLNTNPLHVYCEISELLWTAILNSNREQLLHCCLFYQVWLIYYDMHIYIIKFHIHIYLIYI